MTEPATDLARPRGQYGVDGDYQIDEAFRVLRPGGRVVIADLGFTRLYASRLRQRGMADVTRRDLGWRAWWGLPFFRTHAVTATKPGPHR